MHKKKITQSSITMADLFKLEAMERQKNEKETRKISKEQIEEIKKWSLNPIKDHKFL